MPNAKRPFVVVDAETDPFLDDRETRPFMWGVQSSADFRYFWGDDCTMQLIEWLFKCPPLQIYAHNGGKFDFFLRDTKDGTSLLQYFENEILMVNGRILKANMMHHEFRDSFGILPFPLKSFRKTDIDYAKLERSERNKNRKEIVQYCADDCRDEYKLVDAFKIEFGDKLTMAGTSAGIMRKYHKYEQIEDEETDAAIRKYYMGGRVQCFKTGLIHAPVKIYDVNSMYPAVMKNENHPFSAKFSLGRKIKSDTFFATIEAENDGALVLFNPKTFSLDFTQPKGIFHASIHEINAGLETGTLRIKKVVEAMSFKQFGKFDRYVDHFYNRRLEASRLIDECERLGTNPEAHEIEKLLMKFLLNGGYGRTAINPRDHQDCIILPSGKVPYANQGNKGVVYRPQVVAGKYTIWGRPAERRKFDNVAIGASITGAARAVMLRGLAAALDPYYCDTDSIFCRELKADVDRKRLGAWKLEKEGDCMAIAGKKTYAVFGQGEDCVTGAVSAGACLKKAHKGAKLSPLEIIKISQGAEVEYRSPVPNFKADGTHRFVHRVIRATAAV